MWPVTCWVHWRRKRCFLFYTFRSLEASHYFFLDEHWSIIVVWPMLHGVLFVSHVKLCSFTEMLNNSYGLESLEPEHGEHAIRKLGRYHQLTIAFLFSFEKTRRELPEIWMRLWDYYFQQAFKKTHLKCSGYCFFPQKEHCQYWTGVWWCGLGFFLWKLKTFSSVL